MFVYLEDPLREIEAPGLSLVPLDIDSAAAKFDLTLFVSETGRGLRAKLEYDADLFEPATIDRMLDALPDSCSKPPSPSPTPRPPPCRCSPTTSAASCSTPGTRPGAEAPAGPLAHRRFEAAGERGPPTPSP